MKIKEERNGNAVGNRVGEMSSTLQFHKDNLRHLSRFPDFFVTKRILSTFSYINNEKWRVNPLETTKKSLSLATPKLKNTAVDEEKEILNFINCVLPFLWSRLPTIGSVCLFSVGVGAPNNKKKEKCAQPSTEK